MIDSLKRSDFRPAGLIICKADRVVRRGQNQNTFVHSVDHINELKPLQFTHYGCGLLTDLPNPDWSNPTSTLENFWRVFRRQTDQRPEPYMNIQTWIFWSVSWLETELLNNSRSLRYDINPYGCCIIMWRWGSNPTIWINNSVWLEEHFGLKKYILSHSPSIVSNTASDWSIS